MTSRMLEHARAIAPAGLSFEGHTATTGASYISTPEAAAQAASIVEDMVHDLMMNEPPEAILIACFGDPGLFQVRARVPVPVIGMADASCHVAAQLGERFAIVTGGHAWGPMLTEFVERVGLTSRFVGVRTLDLTGDLIATDPLGVEANILAEANAAYAEGAAVVILGGAGLVGFAQRLGPLAKPILLDSLSCGVSQAAAMVQFGHCCR